jgi:hypothetical protein
MEPEKITLEKIYEEIKKLELALKKGGAIKQIESPETALLSERSLAEEWLSPEEDEAWKNL